MKRFKKPITIFYFLVLYALAELTWWGYLLLFDIWLQLVLPPMEKNKED